MATIKEIAEQTHLSSSTVSRILNDDPTLNVPLQTRQLVLETARKLNYIKKNKKARRGDIAVMGIIVWTSPQKEIEDPYYLSIRQGAEDYCQKHQLAIIRVYQSDISYLDQLQTVDGLICIGKFSQSDIQSFKKLTKRIVIIDMNLNPISACHIVLDFQNALDEVISSLSQMNHRQIGYLGGKEFVNDELYPDTRKAYFIKACQKYGCQYESFIYEDQYTSESGFQMATQLLSQRPYPTALFCANDLIAIGALKAFHDHNIWVPEDISVIGFDNIDLTNYTNPPLTSVLAPTYDMGNIGAKIIHHAMLEQSNPPNIKIQLPCYLIHKASCQTL